MASAIPFRDDAIQNRLLQEELQTTFTRVVVSGAYELGAELFEFQTAFRGWVGAAYAVGVQSGSSALLLALLALDVGPDDEVVTTANVDMSVPAAISHTGARVRFADIVPETHTIDPESLFSVTTDQTRAVIVVHTFGLVADLDAILPFCRERRIAVVEDCALALGSRHGDRHVGVLGDVGCFSFSPGKPMGGLGNGGLIVTASPSIWRRCRLLRGYGRLDVEGPRAEPDEQEHLPFETPGWNLRLDNLQAAFLRVKLRRVPAWVERRRRLAASYRARLADIGVAIPRELPNTTPIYWRLPVRLKRRDRVQAHLKVEGIEAIPLYVPPMHLQPANASDAGPHPTLPHTEAVARELLCLPLHPSMDETQVDVVAAALRRALAA